jgi:hypothetical protein
MSGWWFQKGKKQVTYNTHGHTPALHLSLTGRCQGAGGARELRFPPSKKAQFVTECGIIHSFVPTKHRTAVTGA